eukprot:TRINITY_DN7519_c0_g1_i1.p1 TRINITY_DN7519_c0_g1~~TRINITY_DN7519_c0_g1_i1.p1  ORF type:complete len:651 (-),score=95.54 TRINITY_DN7519_c0_g1_i1:424-2376(-)
MIPLTTKTKYTRKTPPPADPVVALEDDAPECDVEGKKGVTFDSTIVYISSAPPRKDDVTHPKLMVDNAFKEAFGFTLRWIVVYVGIRAVMPVLCNAAWVAAANLGGCGGGLQSFWTFLFEYDFYFMLLKALMISMYFLCFMPKHSTTLSTVYIAWIHGLLVLFMVSFNVGLGLLWWALDLHDKELVTWMLFKINFPASATLSFVAWAPFCICLNYSYGERSFAFKRYVLLVVILVLDVIFIATSLAYVWAYMYVSKNVLPHHVWLERQAIQSCLVVGFTVGYMTALGKIWQLGIFLMDRIAPMEDLKRQRFVFFATVICDMHRVLYCRELFANLEVLYVFYVFLLNEFTYLMYQFALKSTLVYQTYYIRMFEPEQSSAELSAFIKLGIMVVRHAARLLQAPGLIMAWAKVDIDAGFDTECEAFVKTVYFFCADVRITIRNLPSVSIGRIASIMEKSKEDQKQEILSCVATTSAKDEADPLEGCDNQQRSYFDTCVSSRVALHQLESSEGDSPHDPALQLIKHVQLRLNSIIFIRAQGRLTISLATAFSHLLMHLVIRASPSRDVLNTIHDHKEQLELNKVVVSISFVFVDLLAMVIVYWVHLKPYFARQLNVARFGRLFAKSDFFIMILLCTICCNSDFFLTYPLMRFCQ